MENKHDSEEMDSESLTQYKEKIYPECVRIIYRERVPNLMSNILVSALPLYIGWTEETWLTNLLLTSTIWMYVLIAYYFTQKFNSSVVPNAEVKPWSRLVFYQMIGAAFLYNIIFMHLAFHEVENAMFYLLMVTALLSAGCVSSYQYLKWLGPLFVLIAMLPQCLYYLISGQHGGALVSFLIVVFIIFMTNIGLNLHKNAIHTLSLNHLLRDEKEKAENATKLKDKFVSLVSHDLRGPISSMHGLMELAVSKGATQDVMLKSAKLSMNTSSGLLRMIEKLLDIGRLQTGVVSPQKHFFSVDLLVVEKIAKLKQIADNKDIGITNKIPKDARLFADSTLIGEVILNLLGNAVKFSPIGGTITISMPEKSVIAVSDTGEGIPQKILPDIFKYEVKTIGIGTAGETGTGLGLPLCSDIMKAHGGDLGVETSENGSSFHVVLPAEKPVVMIVDDQEVHRAIMKEQVLTASDVDFVEAENGKEALERLKEAKPILVITDIIMPEMGGFELLKEIRNIWSSEELPVIVGTSISSSSPGDGESIDTKTTAFNYGANDFIMKPIIPAEFIPRVKRYLP